MTADDALDALERLGLTRNEAKLLLGLQRIGSGTARELADATDVPRSQVYGTAEGLEQKGVVYVQQATPKRYHAADPDEIESILRARFEQDLDTAIDRLEQLQHQQDPGAETREEIWTIRGLEAIDERIEQLIAEATSRIVFGVSSETLLSDQIVELLQERAADGLDVLVISRDEAVRDRFEAMPDIHAVEPPETITENDQTGRIVIVDDASILHSVVAEASPFGVDTETAFWSQDSGFARMVITLMRETIQETIADDN